MNILDLDPYSILKLNYRVIHDIFMSQNHQNNIIYLIQICYKTTSRLKPKSMKTSDTMAWMQSFHTRVSWISSWIGYGHESTNS